MFCSHAFTVIHDINFIGKEKEKQTIRLVFPRSLLIYSTVPKSQLPTMLSIKGLMSTLSITMKRPSPHDLQEPKFKMKRTENIFSNMRLRRIVKENHGQDISQLSFFFNDNTRKRSARRIDTSNVLTSVGGCEVKTSNISYGDIAVIDIQKS